MTYPHLESSPEDHLSPEFMDYLRATNDVIFDIQDWLVIRNCKYDHQDGKKGWWTAFHKKPIHHQNELKYNEFEDLAKSIPLTWEVRIKSSTNRTVKRFHVHFIEPV